VEAPRGEHPFGFAGMAELWFEDGEDLLAVRQSPDWKVSTEDEENFVDRDRVAYFVAEERIIFEEPKQHT
jgi:hypothetical protein